MFLCKFGCRLMWLDEAYFEELFSGILKEGFLKLWMEVSVKKLVLVLAVEIGLEMVR